MSVLSSPGFSTRHWVLRAFGRNPLVRPSDRVEASVTVLAALVVLLAIPFVGAVGTAVHEDRAHLYASQAAALHSVEATVTRRSVTELRGYSIRISAPVAWEDPGQRSDGKHTEVVALDAPVHAGDTIKVWLDDGGNRVDAPPDRARAGAEAVAAALALWVSVATVSAMLVALVHLRLGRLRARAWDRELQHLVGDDGGRR